MHYYVYAYLDLRKPGSYRYPGFDYIFPFEPFYVGKGKETRYKRHLNRSQLENGSNPHKQRLLTELIQEGFNPLNYVVIVATNLSPEEAVCREIILIKAIGRRVLNTGPLTNLTDGGEGMWGNVSALKGLTYEEIHGAERAAELKRQKSERFSGSGNPMFGQTSWCKGRRLSPKTRAKISARRSRAVKQLDMEGNLLREWDSPERAAEALGLAGGSSIRNAANPTYRAKTAGGFQWEWSDETNPKVKRSPL